MHGVQPPKHNVQPVCAARNEQPLCYILRTFWCLNHYINVGTKAKTQLMVSMLSGLELVCYMIALES